MSTASAPEQAASVPAELQYLAPGSTVLRRFKAPGASINMGSYEPHIVPIRDGRPMQGNFRTDIHGFEIVSHRSAVSEFTDKAEVDAAYRSPSATFAVSETTRVVFHDSDHSRPWRVLHSAFPDPTVEPAVPRHSIEVRTFAFFH